jgi:hydroxyacylglutathione hydrolase
MKIEILKAFSDNYVYVISDPASPEIAVVDPGEAEPVFRYLDSTGRRLSAIMITHHHSDHVGGNGQLLERFPDVPVLGGAADRERIPGLTRSLQDRDTISVCGFMAQILEIPGHTRGHIAYFFQGEESGTGDLFSGDTVFGATIGNLFEGTPDIIFQSLQKICALPRDTRIWCSHEYTLQCVRDTARALPGNPELEQRLERVEAQAELAAPTVPLSLREECATNPFFRWDDPALAAQLGTGPGIETFRRVCEVT